MALDTRIWRTERFTEVRPGDPHAVVPAPVYSHIGLLRHVTVHTLTAERPHDVMVMSWGIKRTGIVALTTKGVAFCHQLIAVRLMTIGTNNTSGVHLALDE